MNLVLFTGLIIVVVFVVALALGQRALREHRGVSREEFISAFVASAIPEDIPAAVYDYYKKGVVFQRFSIAPDDSYVALHEEEEDIDDDAKFLMRKLSLTPPSREAQQLWNERTLSPLAESPTRPMFVTNSTQLTQPVKTIREMVLWLNWVREHQKDYT